MGRAIGIQTIDDFLPADLIDSIHKHVSNNAAEYLWRPNTNVWDPRLTSGSPAIMLMSLDALKDELFNVCKMQLGAETISGLSAPYPVFYDAPRGSYVNWHTDKTPIGISIYLNEFWERDWGGLFLYDEGSGIRGIKPEFNKAVIASSNIPHCVSPVSLISGFHRYSVQIFLTEKELVN